MCVYYIDYENVHNGGTTGIDQLKSDDEVLVFYTKNANTLMINTVEHFMNSKAIIRFILVDSGTPNALDFQLITYLFSTGNVEGKHYIIAQDKGYDAAIKMAKRLGYTYIYRMNRIADALMENDSSTTEQEIQPDINQNKIEFPPDDIIKKKLDMWAVKNVLDKLSDDETEILYDGLRHCDKKISFYNYLRKGLGDKRGKCLYMLCRADFCELRRESVASRVGEEIC